MTEIWDWLLYTRGAGRVVFLLIITLMVSSALATGAVAFGKTCTWHPTEKVAVAAIVGLGAPFVVLLFVPALAVALLVVIPIGSYRLLVRLHHWRNRRVVAKAKVWQTASENPDRIAAAERRIR
jgi:hypothetical protein